MSKGRAAVAREKRGPIDDLVDNLDSLKINTKALGARGFQLGKSFSSVTAFTEELADLSPQSREGVYMGVQELAWPINEGAILDGGHIHSMRAISAKEARGRILGVPHRLVEWFMVTAADKQGKALAMRTYLSVGEDFSCRDVSNHAYDHSRNGRAEVGRLGQGVLDALSGLSAQGYYDWHVEVRTGSGLRLSIPTSAKMAQALLSQRDLPSGLTRRQAIRHLVSSHSRRLASGSEVQVVEHLRGRQAFVWDGLSGFVVPPRYDRDRLDRLGG